jgi:hypothetical protein
MTRPYRLLALAPVIAILGAPWFANRIEPRIFGMPFLLGWIVGWVLMTTVIMALIGALDTRAERADTTGTGRPAR